MPINSYTREPHPPPPVWEQHVCLHTSGKPRPKAGRSGSMAVGHVLCDEPLEPALGTTNVLELWGSKCRLSKYVIGPADKYARPSKTGYVEWDANCYHQNSYLIIMVWFHQRMGMSLFRPLENRKGLTYNIGHLEPALMPHKTKTMGQGTTHRNTSTPTVGPKGQCITISHHWYSERR